MSTQFATRLPGNFDSTLTAPVRSTRSATSVAEESLIDDVRSRRTPSQEVERRLVGMLQGMFVPVSHVRSTAVCRSRFNRGTNS